MSVRIATYNSPHRLLPHKATFQALADRGVEILCAQENTDYDPKANCPRGWRYYRPRAAQSNVVYWNPNAVTKRRVGHVRLSSPDFKSLRYLVWVEFSTPLGPMKVASIHLPAFYSTNVNAQKEYDKQVVKVAAWADESGLRIIAGDYNGDVESDRMKPLMDVMVFSDPVASGPGGSYIDYVAASERGKFFISSTERGPRGNSDHHSVICDVSKEA